MYGGWGGGGAFKPIHLRQSEGINPYVYWELEAMWALKEGECWMREAGWWVGGWRCI